MQAFKDDNNSKEGKDNWRLKVSNTQRQGWKVQKESNKYQTCKALGFEMAGWHHRLDGHEFE